jgi:hypothetical protein
MTEPEDHERLDRWQAGDAGAARTRSAYAVNR